ncbi:MAG: inositol monophosphatase family protein [Hydrotalea sp.]|nr:inositol monophosphatase family protein [Hydrotalea sp.]
MINKQEIEGLLNLLADEAGRVQMRHWRNIPPAEFKSDHSPVTIADKETESAIRALLKKHRPDDGILGEEWGNENLDKEYVWVIDPIDGTKGFMVGGVMFTTLIALCQNGVPIAGVINQPVLKERYIGFQGLKDDISTMNGKALSTRTGIPLERAIGFFSGTDLVFTPEQERVFKALKGVVRIKRSCYDSYAYGLLAMGFVDVICETQMAQYDKMALAPVVNAAGGIITNWRGEPISMTSGTETLAAGSKELHAAALKIVQSAMDK